MDIEAELENDKKIFNEGFTEESVDGEEGADAFEGEDDSDADFEEDFKDE